MKGMKMKYETRGPLALRDLDVLLRTNEINSSSYGWKNGMKQWKALNEIQQIKQSILQSSKEILEIEKKKGALLEHANTHEIKLNPDEKNQQQSEEQDAMIENQDQNPLQILEVTVENLLQKTFHQSDDGKWSIYDEQKQQWVIQDQQPTQKIAKMKNFLFNKLKNELFSEQKERKKKKVQVSQEPTQVLTKEQLQKKQRNKKKTRRAAEKKKQKWYHAKINTFIYISGLPFDITEAQLKDFVSKAGVLRIDLGSGEEKIKIYRDENNLPKGDAVVSYAREQSVGIALQMLNDSQIRDGFKVKIERASFNQKEQEYKPRQAKKNSKVKKMLAKKNEQKKLGWESDEEKGDGFKIVVFKHIFSTDFLSNQGEIQEIKKDLTSELERIGPLKRIRFYENHPQGIVEVKFAEDKQAQECIQIMNGRFFDGRQIICEYWDGETDFKRDAHSLLLQKQRLEKYGEKLEEDEGDNSDAKDQPPQKNVD